MKLTDAGVSRYFNFQENKSFYRLWFIFDEERSIGTNFLPGKSVEYIAQELRGLAWRLEEWQEELNSGEDK